MSQIKNRTIFTRDNLEVMRGMDGDTVDLIYLDPPFNKKKQFQAPIGSEAAGATFKDWWVMDDIKEEWVLELRLHHPHIADFIKVAGRMGAPSNTPYLLYMAPRLLEMRRVLKPSGSIYLHCDPTMSHYLKILMDRIFGYADVNFRNEIIWHYYNGASSAQDKFARKHDVILFYAKDKGNYFNNIDTREPYVPDSNYVKNPESYKGGGKPNPHGKRRHDVWRLPSINNMAKERTGYPTQKPLRLLEQIIRASSNEDGLVLDPFCGCATTCVAAEILNRRWIGIDVAERSLSLTWKRISTITDDMAGYAGQPLELKRSDLHSRTDIPIRTVKAKRSKNIKTILYGKQGGHCNLCDTHLEMRHLEIDHIVARSSGGQDADENLQLLCGHCNRTKGNRTQAEARKIINEFLDLPKKKPRR